MQRLIYCPGQEHVDEASLLSKKLSLPIVVGESESISSIDFDRNSVCVIQVPEKHNVVFKDVVECGFHQSIKYTNDFVDFNNGVTVKDGDMEFFPVLAEKHYCHFVYTCDVVGSRSFLIKSNEAVLEERNYVVN